MLGGDNETSEGENIGQIDEVSSKDTGTKRKETEAKIVDFKRLEVNQAY